MANLIRVEQVPGEDKEIRYFDDVTSVAVSMPIIFKPNQPHYW